MENYYQILGIHPLSDSTQIRAAYKRMAMAYHPDHNPDNREAEEIFKLVNEAYHTLSDPLKKSRYDSTYFPQYIAPHPRERLRAAYPKSTRGAYYKVDREYFKTQGLSIAVFVVIAGFCFGLMNIIHYFAESKRQRHYQENTKELKLAGSLFASGRFEDAIRKIDTLAKVSPMEYRTHYTLDSLVSILRREADGKYDTKDYASAAALYLLIRKYDTPVADEVMRKLSISEYYLGNYAESFDAMKHLHEKYPDNLELVYSIGILSLDKLQQPGQALHYFTVGKRLVDQRMASMPRPSTKHVSPPNLFSEVLNGRARSNLLLSNFEEAVADCSSAISLNPDAGEPYKLRALANARIRKTDTICNDVALARKRGAADLEDLEREFCR